MTDATITIDPTGNGGIDIGAAAHPLTENTVPEARAAAVRHVVAHARNEGRDIEVTAHEPGGTFYLSVSPDGTVTPIPEPAGPVQPDAPVVADDDPVWQERASQPATEGARGRFNAMLGAKIAPSPAELERRRSAYALELEEAEQQRQAEQLAEQEAAAQESRRAARRREEEEAERALRRLIQKNFQKAKTILVANPKGGMRKTTTVYLLAATFGIIRGGSVIAWDANETVGTLGHRAAQDEHQRTVVDLLEQAAADFNSVEGSRLGTLDAYVRPQGDSHFDVLASDEDPERQDIVDSERFATVHEILSRFYRMILVDTGNNIRVSHFLAALEAADQLVIPVAASEDGAYGARYMIDSLRASGHDELVKNAVVLIHDLEPASNASAEYLELAHGIADEFAGQVAAVLPVPFDPALKGGNEIDYAQLTPATQRAYREAAGAIAASLGRDRARQVTPAH